MIIIIIALVSTPRPPFGTITTVTETIVWYFSVASAYSSSEQNNVNRTFKWKYRLKSLYREKAKNVSRKWAFLFVLWERAQPSDELKCESIVYTLECQCAVAFIRWIGLIKKSFYCEWSENTHSVFQCQYWWIHAHNKSTLLAIRSNFGAEDKKRMFILNWVWHTGEKQILTLRWKWRHRISETISWRRWKKGQRFRTRNKAHFKISESDSLFSVIRSAEADSFNSSAEKKNSTDENKLYTMGGEFRA